MTLRERIAEIISYHWCTRDFKKKVVEDVMAAVKEVVPEERDSEGNLNCFSPEVHYDDGFNTCRDQILRALDTQEGRV